ncbi:MAG: helix-turn-helix domain-containing protein [Caldilineaceae bacterium]
MLTQLVAGPLSPAKVERAQMSTLNWLINQAVVSFGPQGYKLYSPLFAEFIAPRLLPAQEQAPRPVTPGTPLEDLPIYTELTKTEEALLRYFRARANTIISPEQLLADVWNRPDASPRRVQEAIRRLRLQLAEARPPVGNIENERGRGYRFVPSGA